MAKEPASELAVNVTGVFVATPEAVRAVLARLTQTADATELDTTGLTLIDEVEEIVEELGGVLK